MAVLEQHDRCAFKFTGLQHIGHHIRSEDASIDGPAGYHVAEQRAACPNNGPWSVQLIQHMAALIGGPPSGHDDGKPGLSGPLQSRHILMRQFAMPIQQRAVKIHHKYIGPAHR